MNNEEKKMLEEIMKDYKEIKKNFYGENYLGRYCPICNRYVEHAENITHKRSCLVLKMSKNLKKLELLGELNGE